MYPSFFFIVMFKPKQRYWRQILLFVHKHFFDQWLCLKNHLVLFPFQDICRPWFIWPSICPRKIGNGEVRYSHTFSSLIFLCSIKYSWFTIFSVPPYISFRKWNLFICYSQIVLYPIRNGLFCFKSPLSAFNLKLLSEFKCLVYS